MAQSQTHTAESLREISLGGETAEIRARLAQTRRGLNPVEFALTSMPADLVEMKAAVMEFTKLKEAGEEDPLDDIKGLLLDIIGSQKELLAAQKGLDKRLSAVEQALGSLASLAGLFPNSAKHART